MGMKNPTLILAPKINFELFRRSLKAMGTMNILKKTAPQEEAFSHRTALSYLLTNMWPKFMASMSDRVCVQRESPKFEMPEKQPHSPKLRSKLNIVARGRGRGRAKSQLRRSGVSQSRHRHEQIRRKLIADIHEDLDTWETFEGYYELQYDDLSNVPNFESDLENQLDEDDVPVKQCYSVKTSIADVTLRKQKQNMNKVIEPELNKFPTKVRYVPEVSVDVDVFLHDEDEHKDENECKCECECKYESKIATSQSRSLSESSADSEDSYCIIFDNETESDYETDYEETSDEEEDLDTNDNLTPQKVKFNLKPTIHTMVHWNYAYRAARKGPWERMARDRERFRRRIYCIGQVLDPILTAQHRNRIWQERFSI